MPHLSPRHGQHNGAALTSMVPKTKVVPRCMRSQRRRLLLLFAASSPGLLSLAPTHPHGRRDHRIVSTRLIYIIQLFVAKCHHSTITLWFPCFFFLQGVAPSWVCKFIIISNDTCLLCTHTHTHSSSDSGLSRKKFLHQTHTYKQPFLTGVRMKQKTAETFLQTYTRHSGYDDCGGALAGGAVD